ncbi:MAG TPA: hypothetical protein VFT80_15575, partial [Actinomycetota bacterium]|nr:hypothetical protein [Actinomycetota bacterium]
ARGRETTNSIRVTVLFHSAQVSHPMGRLGDARAVESVIGTLNPSAPTLPASAKPKTKPTLIAPPQHARSGIVASIVRDAAG